jgi:hypothetical protein
VDKNASFAYLLQLRQNTVARFTARTPVRKHATTQHETRRRQSKRSCRVFIFTSEERPPLSDLSITKMALLQHISIFCTLGFLSIPHQPIRGDKESYILKRLTALNWCGALHAEVKSGVWQKWAAHWRDTAGLLNPNKCKYSGTSRQGKRHDGAVVSHLHLLPNSLSKL